jgi:hypothetical protein
MFKKRGNSHPPTRRAETRPAPGCVLASLNASTYWKVRLGISLAAALSDDAFEHPAVPRFRHEPSWEKSASP